MMKNTNWIYSPADKQNGAILFSKELRLKKDFRRAVIAVSSMGVYALFVDGNRIGKNILAPGWTSYPHRVQYQTYDLTDVLKPDSTIAIGVAPGWAVGHIGYDGGEKFFADHKSVIAELTLTDEKGKKIVLSTDPSWSVMTTSVTYSDIYMGETVDLTAPIKDLGHAVIDASKHPRLVRQIGEDITEQEIIVPTALIHTPKGETVVDFGQNMTGYAEVKIKGKSGDRIVIHHAEVLDANGNFYNENYRTARNEMTYILDGKEDVFKPTYTFEGFRYIRLTEYPFADVDLNNFRAIAVHSDMKRTGTFVCGNEKINQLYHNIIWGQKSNYLDIPTDCPQRDERLGWTGDAQVFFRTAAINYNVKKFFTKWLGDMALEQLPNGAVMGIVPLAQKRPTRISAAWGDSACIIPWELYLAYGDKNLLRQHFPMMKKWVEYMRHAGSEEYLWLGGYHYGDWLAMDAGADSYVEATSNDLIASAFYAHSTELVIRAGEELGEDVTEYKQLYRNIVKAFRSYFMKDGMPKEELPYTEVIQSEKASSDSVRKGITQTALTLILHFGLCLPEERKAIADKLEELIHGFGERMSTGFVGTPYLLHALSENGKTELAYKLLFQEQNPSWLYSVNHGATTMWEHWNGIKEDGSFWSTDMNSFNHYAYGAVYDWIFGVAVGIKPTSPAYETVSIEPHPCRELGFADASVETKFGKIRVHWYFRQEQTAYEIEIPKGVTAVVKLPDGTVYRLEGGRYHF